MSWDKLDNTQQSFVEKFFVKGKSWRKKAHDRSANKNVTANYEAYMSAKLKTRVALKDLKQLGIEEDFQEKYDSTAERIERKGDFALGEQLFDQMTNKMKKVLETFLREGEKEPSKHNSLKEFQQKVRDAEATDKKLISGVILALSPSSGVGPDPNDLPLVKAYTALFTSTHIKLKRACEKAETVEEVDKAFKTVIEAFEKERKEHKTAFGKLKPGSKDLESAKGTLADLGDFESKLTECRTLAAALDKSGHPKAAKLEKDLESINKESVAKSAFDIGLESLKGWLKDAQKELDSYLGEFAKALQTHKDNLAKVVARQNDIGKKVPAEQKQQLQDLIDIAQQTLEDGEQEGNGKNLLALRPLQQVIVSASNLANELAGAESFNKATAGTIKKIEAILGSVKGGKLPEGATLLPEKFAVLREEFEQLHADWLTKSPKEAQMEFIELQFKAEKFQATVAIQKEWLAKLRDTIKKARKLVKDLSKIVFDLGKEDHGWVATKVRDIFGRTGIEFEGTATDDLNEIETRMSWEDATTHKFTEDKVLALYVKLTKWHDAANSLKAASKKKTDPTSEDMRIVEEILDDQAAAVAKREELEAKIEKFKEINSETSKSIDQLATRDNISDSVKEEFADIEQLNDAARKQCTVSLEAAEEMQARVNFRILKALGAPPKEPDNYAWMSKMETYWAKEVDQLSNDLAGLGGTVSRAAKEDPHGIDLGQLEKDLGKFAIVVNGFNKGVFQAASDVLGQKPQPKDQAERKRKREEALQQVRLYRGLLQSNPMVKLAVANPFGVGGIAVGLNTVLNKIELEVLRGI